MHRRPRIAPALIALTALVALFAATSATGRSTAKPANTLEPTIVPTKQAIVVGTNLTGNKGNWSGTEPITYHYQWLRCNEDGQKCAKIQNARGTTYTIVQKDAGHTLRFGVEAQNSDGKAQAVSNASAEIPGSAKAPAATAIPTISGSAVVGEKLTATTGSWAGTQPITFTINWQVCNADHSGCHGNGSKGAVYTVANADVGKRLRVRVDAKNSA